MHFLLAIGTIAIREREKLFVLVLGVVAVLFFCLGTSAGTKWKALAGALLVFSAILQLACADAVPAIIPFVMQIFICIWVFVYWRMP